MLDYRQSMTSIQDSNGFQNDFSERGRKIIDGSISYQYKSHISEIKTLKQQLKTFLVYGQYHDYDDNDPIFQLCIQTPINHENPVAKACYSCSKKGGDDVTCEFCGYKSCTECTQKKRKFPGQPVMDKASKLKKGKICKVCERKFQLKILHLREMSKIADKEQTIENLNKQLEGNQSSLEQIKRECQDKRQQIMRAEAQNNNIQEQQNLDIERMEDLVKSGQGQIKKTETQIQDLINKNQDMKSKKKQKEENLKSVEKQIDKKNECMDRLAKELKYLSAKFNQIRAQLFEESQKGPIMGTYQSNYLNTNVKDDIREDPNIPLIIKNRTERKTSQQQSRHADRMLHTDARTNSSRSNQHLDHFATASILKANRNSGGLNKKMNDNIDKKACCESNCNII
ncbi:UNKNOWN [Stylonychia lemnae]|uniref:Uncharacterized protein n=1 Tax=Stylonychia lemnae TaxID=5949 RepID=A0A078A1E4_STYLE|nr:UNKNOWN [Stylonychia lemnae]|eukprot:CDW74599.1 UNKNOWN [Stylonychia lemnae]